MINSCVNVLWLKLFKKINFINQRTFTQLIMNPGFASNILMVYRVNRDRRLDCSSGLIIEV